MDGALRATGWLLRRLVLQVVPTLFAICTINFFVLNLMPGDAVDALMSLSGSASEETMAALRERFGLDQPLLSRYVAYITNVVQLQFGTSVLYGVPVLQIILERLSATLALMVTALGIAYVVGVAVGWVMAAFSGRWPDRILTVIVMLLYSAPGFWVGLMAIALFSGQLGWLPSGGAESIGRDLQGWAWLGDRIRHLILPAMALAAFFIAIYARLTRAAMLEALRQDYIRTAEAKGLHPFTLQFRHALRNALIGVTTVAGLHAGNMLGGAVVVETVFSWPGLGRLMMTALVNRDFSLIMGVFLVSAVIMIVTNLLVDWITTLLDPRTAR